MKQKNICTQYFHNKIKVIYYYWLLLVDKKVISMLLKLLKYLYVLRFNRVEATLTCLCIINLGKVNGHPKCIGLKKFLKKIYRKRKMQLIVLTTFYSIHESEKIIRYSRSTINAYFLFSHEWWVPLIHGGTHHSCERREYVFMVLREYTIISRLWHDSWKYHLFINKWEYCTLLF